MKIKAADGAKITKQTATPYIRPEHTIKNPARRLFQFWKPKKIVIPECWCMHFDIEYSLSPMNTEPKE